MQRDRKRIRAMAMKAVMANVPEHILEWRRRTGADQWEYRSRQLDADGWSRSTVAGVEMRTAANDKLEIRVIGREDTQARLP